MQFLNKSSKNYHGKTSPFECQKVPELSNDNKSILEISPLTDSSGDIPLVVKLVIRVLTNPGCRIATAIPLGFKSIDNDLPTMQSAA